MQRQWALIAVAFALGGLSPGPHRVVRTSPQLEFTYAWPAEAAASPTLDLRLYKEAKRDLTEAQKIAAQDQSLAKQQKRDFNPHYFSMQWSAAGQTARLLSLQSDLGTFTGGAHPNSSYGALLWDRRQNRETRLDALFLQPKAFAALARTPFCAALDRERAKRRKGEKLGGEFNACPEFSDLAIAPVDRSKNGRFDAIQFVASPYVAGPYVEGEYEISLPVTSQLIAAIRPEYRTSFERQRQ